MLNKIRPLHDRVLVQRIESTNKTDGGIIIPDAAKEKAQTAKVLAVGPGRTDSNGKVVPMQVKVGDVVFYGKYAGTEASDDTMIIREDEILGVVEE